LPGARVENSPSFANRKRDIASWQVGKIGALSSREKKRYLKRKSAIKEYFTTDAPPEEIALQQKISWNWLKSVRCSTGTEKSGVFAP